MLCRSSLLSCSGSDTRAGLLVGLAGSLGCWLGLGQGRNSFSEPLLEGLELPPSPPSAREVGTLSYFEARWRSSSLKRSWDNVLLCPSGTTERTLLLGELFQKSRVNMSFLSLLLFSPDGAAVTKDFLLGNVWVLFLAWVFHIPSVSLDPLSSLGALELAAGPRALLESRSSLCRTNLQR